MSEYRYYEFRAVDRPLSAEEMGELRRISSRAEISSTSFVNEYNWGDLKAWPSDLMERYFDGYLSVANYGVREVMLRLPIGALPLEAVEPYLADVGLRAWETEAHLVLHFWPEIEGYVDGYWEDKHLLGSILAIREQLLRGDYRALYLGWLAGVSQGAVWEDEQEPPVPAGLGALDGGLEALAQLLVLDSDLLEAAAEASREREAGEEALSGPMRAWLQTVSTDRKDVWLMDLIRAGAEAAEVRGEIWRRFAEERADREEESVGGERRSVAELLAHRDALAEERYRREAEAQRRLLEKRRAEAAAQRAKHLDRIAANEDAEWEEVTRLIEAYGTKNYAEAVSRLVDLRAMHERARSPEVFERQFEVLVEAYRRRVSLMELLEKEGLVEG